MLFVFSTMASQKIGVCKKKKERKKKSYKSNSTYIESVFTWKLAEMMSISKWNHEKNNVYKLAKQIRYMREVILDLLTLPAISGSLTNKSSTKKKKKKTRS